MDLRERTSSGTRHPWESARLEHVIELLRAHASIRPGSTLLDAGSGDSFVAASIGRAFPGLDVVCWDAHYSDDDLAEPLPGTRRVRTLPEGSYDVVLALDVIEHVEDDVAFLRALRGHVGTHSTLLVTVPAYQHLFSAHDVYLGHYRRYSHKQLAAAVGSGGWAPVVSGGFFSSLLAPRAVSVWLERRRDAKSGSPDVPESIESGAVEHLGTWSRGDGVTRMVKGALRIDATVSRWVSSRSSRGLPGLSLFLVARPSAAA